MVTTKQKLIHKTYRERVTENHQITKEESKRRGTTVSHGAFQVLVKGGEEF